MASTFPSEPLPSREKLLASISKLFDEVGVANLTRRVLSARLGQEYKLNFDPHRKLIDDLVVAKMAEPALKKEVAKATKARDDGPSRGKGKAKAAKEDKSAKKGKREKAEGEPTRANSGFFFFSNEKRPALMEEQKKENGKVNVADIATKLGAAWKAMSDAERAPYEDKAKADKARYESEMTAFTEAGGKRGGVKAPAAAKEGPKRPMNSTFMFIQANREEYKKTNPTASLGDVAKALSERFKNLDPTAKKVWEDKAAADRERYEREKAATK